MVAVAAVQTAPVLGDTAGNLMRATDAVRAALGRGAELVVLPELAISAYATDPGQVLELAEPLEGPTTLAMAEIVAQYDAAVVIGLCERAGERVFNTSVVITGDGIAGHYRKLHLYGQEKKAYALGDLGLPVVALPWGFLGLCICYDLRFVEVLRSLALQGADVVAAPAAWVGSFDNRGVPSYASELLPQAVNVAVQANLNQVAVVAASQVGFDGSTVTRGGSIIADAHGQVAAGPASRHDPEILTAQIDIAQVRDAQHRSPLISPRKDRRRDVYSIRLGQRDL